jgi:hypothetical protein
MRSRSLQRCFTALVLWLCCSVCFAVAEKPTPIKLSDLPEPPAEIRELIEAGQVTLEAGEREASQTPQTGPRITAETNYRITYNYKTRSRWKVDSQNRRVVITVRFRDIEWQPTHRIWFQKRPDTEDFWSNRLVLHEFDHVRISSDHRVAERFEQLLRSKGSITQSLSVDDIVDRAFVDRLVDEHVVEMFSEISDLVSIRYKELDRVTSHGLNPLPKDSSLSGLLRPSASEATNPRSNTAGSE